MSTVKTPLHSWLPQGSIMQQTPLKRLLKVVAPALDVHDDVPFAVMVAPGSPVEQSVMIANHHSTVCAKSSLQTWMSTM